MRRGADPFSAKCRCLALSVLLLASSSVWADSFKGVVVGVADGDTVTVLDGRKTQHKVRLSGIDAPEKAQPFGTRSKLSLSALAYGQTVTVEWSKRDRYGRLVGKLRGGDGRDLNLAQIRRGMAWWYRGYRKEQPREDQVVYEEAEAVAKANEVGLWSDRMAIPPWEYRKARKRPQSFESLWRRISG